MQNAATNAPLAAHFEQIGKIGAEREREREVNRRRTMIADRDPLMSGAVPQVGGAHEVKRVALQSNTAIVEDVRIGKVRRQRQIVVPNARAEPLINNSRRDR